MIGRLLTSLQRWCVERLQALSSLVPEVLRRDPSTGMVVPLALAALVMGSALAVVRVQHNSRALNDQLNTARKQHDALEIEWIQLRLEEATLARSAVVEQAAREQLGMAEPQHYEVVEDRR